MKAASCLGSKHRGHVLRKLRIYFSALLNVVPSLMAVMHYLVRQGLVLHILERKNTQKRKTRVEE